MPKNTVNNLKTIAKISKNPKGTGVMRFQVLKLLYTTDIPLTVTEMVKIMREKGYSPTQKFVRVVLLEIPCCGIELRVKNVTRGSNKNVPTYDIHYSKLFK
jgi:hypothetical protein